MQEPAERKPGNPLSEREAEQQPRIREMLFEFAHVCDFGEEASDRAVAIVGPAFLEKLINDMLANFLVDDEKEVDWLTGPEGPLGAFGAKVSACYCLGLIGETVKVDLHLVAKIRNRFAHELAADFSDEQITGWCRSFRWHKEAVGELPDDTSPRDLFQDGVNQLVSHLNGLVDLALSHKRQKSENG